MGIRFVSTEPADLAALQKAVKDEPACTAGAWGGGVAAVEGFLRRVVADIGRLPHVRVPHAEFRNYGSGYASYVDVFVARRAGPDIEGLGLALCRLAPFAALFEPGIRSSSFREMPQLGRVADCDVPGWKEECRELRHILDQHGIALLDSQTLALPLDPRLRVETFLGDPPYRVFDAWFHWID
ncbi:hypothetical protein ACFWY5_13105 [Nonomuraea sp. NPDC059007]|uniref:hypothetical protein n=1 Tax=Nonomuraea sp. NPDC059007 TaxID=3346692 RepID=UPI00368C2916